MLRFHGQPQRFCDGYTRREMLRVGCAGIAGLALPNLLRAEAEAGIGSSEKSVIHIVLQGGPSHIDMVDLKPQAPVGIRGEFRPIATKVPGLQFCEYLPKLASVADKIAVIRTVVGFTPFHRTFSISSGYPRTGPTALAELGGRPTISAVVQKLMSPIDPTMPTSVLLNRGAGHKGEGSPVGMIDPGFLGESARAFMATQYLKGKIIRKATAPDRLIRRRRLSESLDTLRRDIDVSGRIASLDHFTQRAYDILLSSKLSDALDLSGEDPKILERYGTHSNWDMLFATFPDGNQGRVHNYGKYNEDLLRARRLIEAGARFVTVTWGHWDTHIANFPVLRRLLPPFDAGLAGLVIDLYERGLDNTTAICVWGEFGRSPKVYGVGSARASTGRDHWPAVGMALLIGGGMRMGQVIGQTDDHAAYVKERPVHIQEVLATLYHHIGLDPRTTQITDLAGRPQYLIEHNEPIRKLI